MRHIVLLNPVAGKENAQHTLYPKLREAFEQLQLPHRLLVTQYAGQAQTWAEELACTGEPVRLYACGGDGTLNEVLQGAYRYPNAEVACIPCGSGNDFLRNFGTQQDFLDFPSIINGTAVAVDLIQVNGSRIAASICSVGLDAKVAYGIPAFRRVPFCGGSAAYELSILKCLLQPLGTHLSISVDGKTEEGEYLLVCVANGSYYGGGYCSAPIARTDDGVLEVVLVKKVSRFLISNLISKYKKGEHFSNDTIASPFQKYIRHLRGKNIVMESSRTFISNIDGECSPMQRLELKVLAHAARFVLPQGLLQTK